MDYLHNLPKQIIHGGECSICPYCYHFEVCRGVINQPCVKCEQFVDLRSVMPVVLCRDCLHYEMGACLKIYDDGAANKDAWQERKPDDFCSYGEKREES